MHPCVSRCLWVKSRRMIWRIYCIKPLSYDSIHVWVTSSNGNISCVTGPLCREFTGHRWIPLTKASDAEFDVFFDLRLNKRLSKPSTGRWFETPSRLSWCHCNAMRYCQIAMSMGYCKIAIFITLQWRHNGRDGVSNHQPYDCLLTLLLRRRSKKTSKPRVTGLCAGNSPHKWPVTRKTFPFDDVIMWYYNITIKPEICILLRQTQPTQSWGLSQQHWIQRSTNDALLGWQVEVSGVCYHRAPLTSWRSGTFRQTDLDATPWWGKSTWDLSALLLLKQNFRQILKCRVSVIKGHHLSHVGGEIHRRSLYPSATEAEFPSNLKYKAHQNPKLKCFSSLLENEDVVGAAPIGDAPTTSEWSIIPLPTKALFILEVWQYSGITGSISWLQMT